MTVLIAGGKYDLDSQALELDSTLEISIELKNKVTSHPVENRSSISDHVFNENARLNITAVVSNTPVASIVRETNNLLQNDGSVYDPSRIQRAYDIIKKWYRDRIPVTVVTDVESFENCVMTDLKLPRSIAWANAAQFEMSFEQIRIATTQTALVLIALPLRDDSVPEQKEQGRQITVKDPILLGSQGGGLPQELRGGG